jgi:predicted adenine nucleotide alpha hydrolase (AANH) superfamily ATPase
VIYPDYQPSQYFQEINLKEKVPERCSLCWTFRLKAVARTAKDKGFDAFSTTLLVSPYQDQDLLRGIGESLEEEENVNFYYADFRPGFHQAHTQAKAGGIYCQKYCGCVFSEQERCRKPAKHR